MPAPAVVTLPDPGERQTGPGGEPLRVVRLLRAPVPIWERASIHTTELVREFSLLTIGQARPDEVGADGLSGAEADHGPAREGHAAVPARLVRLASELQARYAGITDAQQDELEDALTAGELTRDFTYRVPTSVGPACQQLLDLLDEADAYCPHGDLLTLVSPAEQRQFRAWYLGEFIRQLGGEAPRPWPGVSV